MNNITLIPMTDEEYKIWIKKVLKIKETKIIKME